MTSGIPPDEEFQISFGEMFEILGHASQRWLLTQLSEAGPRNGVESISEESILDNKIFKPFTSEIFYIRLPKLNEAEFIEWNHDNQVIKRGPDLTKLHR